jgi:hypothetical protein
MPILPTITGHSSSRTPSMLEIARELTPMTDAQRRGAARVRTVFRSASPALLDTDFGAIERHILDTTANAYRL